MDEHDDVVIEPSVGEELDERRPEEKIAKMQAELEKARAEGNEKKAQGIEKGIEGLKNKIEKNKGSVTNIQSDYASGLVIIKLWYKGKNYAFSYKGKNITEGLSILSWSINRLIDCDLRGILPFERTAKDYLQIASSMKADENFIDADEKYFDNAF